MGLDTLAIVERIVGWAGGGLLAVSLAAIFAGMWAAFRRPHRHVTGLAGRVMRPSVYVAIGVAFFGAAALLWYPLPLTLSTATRIIALAAGAPLYFLGLSLYLWSHWTLGDMFNVSTSIGVQLYAEHRLITQGPFAIVRHPMYLALMVTAFGGLLLYRTWTTVFAFVVFLGLPLRARREELSLAAAFGEQWRVYCRQVPAWIPHLGTKSKR